MKETDHVDVLNNTHIELEGLYLKLSARIHSGLKQEDGEEERNKERAIHASKEFPVFFLYQ